MSIKILCTTSENYKVIYDVFFASLRSHLAPPYGPDGSTGGDPLFTLMLNTIDLSKFTRFGFGEQAWYVAIQEKLAYALRMMSDPAEIAEGEYIVVSDADIQYLQPMKLKDLVIYAKERDLDYYGMRENRTDSFNGGFYILKNTAKARDFMKEVHDRMNVCKNRYADQEILNEILHGGKYNMKHEKIDSKFCVWGKNVPTAYSIFHHAVCALNNHSKLEQMKHVSSQFSKIAI